MHPRVSIASAADVVHNLNFHLEHSSQANEHEEWI